MILTAIGGRFHRRLHLYNLGSGKLQYPRDYGSFLHRGITLPRLYGYEMPEIPGTYPLSAAVHFIETELPLAIDFMSRRMTEFTIFLKSKLI